MANDLFKLCMLFYFLILCFLHFRLDFSLSFFVSCGKRWERPRSSLDLRMVLMMTMNWMTNSLLLMMMTMNWMTIGGCCWWWWRWRTGWQMELLMMMMTKWMTNDCCCCWWRWGGKQKQTTRGVTVSGSAVGERRESLSRPSQCVPVKAVGGERPFSGMQGAFLSPWEEARQTDKQLTRHTLLLFKVRGYPLITLSRVLWWL